MANMKLTNERQVNRCRSSHDVNFFNGPYLTFRLEKYGNQFVWVLVGECVCVCIMMWGWGSEGGNWCWCRNKNDVKVNSQP